VAVDENLMLITSDSALVAIVGSVCWEVVISNEVAFMVVVGTEITK
jgi:hypothetical protein